MMLVTPQIRAAAAVRAAAQEQPREDQRATLDDAAEHFGTLAAVWDEQAEALSRSMGRQRGRPGGTGRPARGWIVDLGCGPGVSAIALGSEVGADGWSRPWTWSRR